LADYSFSKAIAITTYSGLFNTHPRFDDPHVILLDDAHSAENYISSHWTISIDRHDNYAVYEAIIEMLQGSLPEQYLQDMLVSDTRPSFVVRRDIDCVPMPLMYEKLDSLREYLDENIDSNNKWSWSMIRDHLEACQIYVTWRAVTIRPLIPPTFTHTPFSIAKQRVYMSATLGEGGELERSLGLPQVEALPIPEGWDRQTTGRRFVLFPNTSLLDDEIKDLVCKTINLQPRSLVLTPDMAQATEFEGLLSNCEPRPAIWKKGEIEASLDNFVNSQNALLLLTNRYDGIDLPDNDCRVEIIFGEPSATNAQERFFLYRLGAVSLLKNRIRTRMAQALGRCVRNANDYALILMIGSDIANFCKEDNLSALHPEMQAELYFGLENSIGQSLDNFVEMISSFLGQSEDWRVVEEQIVSLRETKERKADSSLEQLSKSAKQEVLFCKSLWMRQYDDAQQCAQQILDQLVGDELTPYRGWWYYLAGYVAWLRYLHNKDGMAFQLAQEHFERASRTSMSVSWLVYLKRLKRDAVTQVVDNDFMVASAIENMYVEFSKIPLQGHRFEQKFSYFENKINSDESHVFDLALKELGELLGFSSESPGGTGTPDAIWYVGDKYIITFEAKSSQKSKGSIGKGDVQQANGHRNWIMANRSHNNAEIICVIVSHRDSLQKDAAPHVEDLRYLKIGEVRELAKKVSSVYRKIRPFASTMAPEKVKEMLLPEVNEKDLSPESVVKKICDVYLKDLEISE